ncbi:MAG: AAA family ATPase [Oligoflexia bacterium]|nr:AAA family ATPase [Oligoflexia bacterium]
MCAYIALKERVSRGLTMNNAINNSVNSNDFNNSDTDTTTANKSAKPTSPQVSPKILPQLNISGHRLATIEMYNWGTFDKKTWHLNFDNLGALLTGENGSGKSTIVDAILTLLVPHKKRNYNLSSGSDRRERSEVTYVKGAYGKEKNEFGQAKSKFLRNENSYSVLLATFKNSFSNELIVLGQFFWFEEGNLRKIYITSHTQLSIDPHFLNFKTPGEFKMALKKISGTTTYSAFSEYEEYFIKHFGLKSSKAMDLFNQVAAIKEIGQLNDFVRKHMLEGQATQDLLEQLYTNYENLSLAHQAILLAKEQLDGLTPIAEEAKNLDEYQKKKSTYLKDLKKIPLFFNLKRKNFLQEFKNNDEATVCREEAILKKIDQELSTLQEQKQQLIFASNSDQLGQQIENLNFLLKQHQEKRDERKNNFLRYQQFAKILELNTDLSLKHFGKNREQLAEIITECQKYTNMLQEEMYQRRREQEQISQELDYLSKEVDSLKKNKGRLPGNYLNLRDQLATRFSVSPSELPFVAELIQVKRGEELWSYVIDKLMYSFAQRLLIPSDLYSEMNKYLNKNNLGLKLVYNRVDLAAEIDTKSDAKIVTNDNGAGPDRSHAHGQNSEMVFEKLEFYTRSPYSKWIKSQITRDYNYACTNDLRIFQSANRAVMPSGLIKRSQALHEKDDRGGGNTSGKNFNSILGWDNKERILEIREQYTSKHKQKDQLDVKLNELKRNLCELEKRTNTARDLESIKDYNSIDWEFYAQEIDKLSKQKDKFENKDYGHGKLQKDINAIELKIAEQISSRDQVLSLLAVAKNNLKRWPTQIKECDILIKNLEEMLVLEYKKNSNISMSTSTDTNTDTKADTKTDTDAADNFSFIEKLLRKKGMDPAKLDLDNLSKYQREFSDEFNTKSTDIDGKIQYHLISLTKKMTQFKNKFPDQSCDLGTGVEYLMDYLKIKERLEKESLPEHERRFKNLLNKSVINDMAAFKSTLELAYETIEENVSQLNNSLKKIAYSESTYVQLHINRSRDVEVREFQNLLKNALKSVGRDGQQIDLEESFGRMKQVLNKLKKDERWCKKVIDIRNWADFYVLELFLENGEQKNYYADSAGLSGGQKAKLAFTILASAIAYQYGLHGSKAQERSFRFVVIDEAFSKSDEKNSRYAMELFKALGLQLMVVTPKDKIYIVEPYVRNIFVTQINEHQDSSRVFTLELEKKSQNTKHPSPSTVMRN